MTTHSFFSVTDSRSPLDQTVSDKMSLKSSSSPTRGQRMDDLMAPQRPSCPVTLSHPQLVTPQRPQTSPIELAGSADSIAPQTSFRRKRGSSVHMNEAEWANAPAAAERQPTSVLTAGTRVSSPIRASFAGSSSRRRDARDGLLRRTSQTCRKFQKAISKPRSRRSSIEGGMDGMEGPAVEPSASKNFFERIAHPRFPGLNKVSRYDTPQPPTGSASSPRHLAPIVLSQSDPRFPSMITPPPDSAFLSPRGGAAARQYAAASNNFSRLHHHSSSIGSMSAFQDIREEKRHRLGSLSSAADSGADLGSNAFDVDAEMLDAPPIESKSDPVAYLPNELNTLIFSYLDADSLRACQQIRPWSQFATDSLTWRCEFQRVYRRESAVHPAPIQIGGMGMGRSDQKMQDWERMYNARKAIDANWAEGKGRAVYMAGHTDSVYCVQFDEKKIITGSRDRTIRVWDINTNRCIKVLGGPSVRPVPGPRVLRTVDYPHFHHAEASVNGLPYGHQIYQTPKDYHSASILCLQYDEEILVTGSSDNDLIVWNVETYEPIHRLKQHQGGVLDVAFDAKHIVSCSKDCSIVIWDRKTMEPLKTLRGHNGPVNAVQLRGNLLVSASGDGVARLWDLTKMECIREFPAKERGLAAVEFSDDAKFVLAGGNDHLTYKFEVATGKEVLQYPGHSQLVRSLFLDTQNKRVVSGSYDLDLRVYDYETGKLISVFSEWTTSWMLAAKCDYRRIVSTSQDGRILVIDFGLDSEGRKIDGVDLLAGTDPIACQDLNRAYPTFTHPSIPKQ